MTDKTLFVFDKKINTFEDFVISQNPHLCTDLFWDFWESPENFSFGFDTMPLWYRDLVKEINEMFNFVQIDILFEIPNTYVASEDPIDCYYAVFNLIFDDDISETVMRQYSYFITVMLRTINLSRMEASSIDYVKRIKQLNNNEATPRIHLLIGMSNIIKGQNRNLYNRTLSIPILEKLTDIEKADKLSHSFEYLKQSNFIKLMTYDEFNVPKKGDIVTVFGVKCVIDVVFSLEFIKVISLEDGQAQFCTFSNINY